MSDVDLGKRLWGIVKGVRDQDALVHCITNPVTVNDCANALLAAGAHPIMAAHPDEVAEVQGGSSALVLNLGAVAQASSMLRAAEAARAAGHPIVVDPVGVSTSTIRRQLCLELLKGGISCLRGNASEVRALVSSSRTAAGLEASASDVASAAGSGRTLAQRFGCVVVVSGAVDRVSDGRRGFAVANGDVMMSRVTGMGCVSTALLGAFFAASASIEAAAACCSLMGLSGEFAAAKTRSAGGGPGTFRTFLIDGLYLLDERAFLDGLKCDLA